MKSTDRNRRIDFLRGMAICLVLLLHFHMSYDLRNSVFGFCFPENLLHSFLMSGNYGVTIFFTVSGYLITSRSMQRYGTLQNINPLNFYTLRFARIFPCMVLSLLLISFIASLNFGSFISDPNKPELSNVPFWLSVLSVLTFWHNVLMGQCGFFNYAMNIFWSLSVEEVFYILFPIIVIFLKKRIWLLTLICTLIIIGPIYRYIHRDNELFYICGYLGCFDAIAYGCLAALIQTKLMAKMLQNNFLQISAALILIYTYLLGIPGNEAFGFSIIAAATAILLIGSSSSFMSQHMFSKYINYPIQFLGRLSYELYLFHLIILGLMRHFITPLSPFRTNALPGNLNMIHHTLLLSAFFAVSISVAYVIYRFYSEPANQKIRRLWFNKTSNIAFDASGNV